MQFTTPTGITPQIPHNPQQQHRTWTHKTSSSSGSAYAHTFKLTKTVRDRSKAPLVKLTVQLMTTYCGISRRHRTPYATTARAAFNDGLDDADHNYIIKLNEVWNDRYRVVRLLGKGSFGQVVECRDLQDKKDVAVKIIKNRRAFHYQGMIEVKILQFLNTMDPYDERNIVRMTSYFEYKNHLCIVYEKLSFNLYDLLRNDKFVGVSLELVKKFAVQILQCLEFLDRPDVQVIHCDLKPENILLRQPDSSWLKVIDFGSSCHSTQKLYTYIQSRFYRSPEVILGHNYTTAIDMWSLGCLLVELLTGRPLFNGINEHDQMCRIVELLGAPKHRFMQNCADEKVNKYFIVNHEHMLSSRNNQLELTYQIAIPNNFKPRPGVTLQSVIAKGIKEQLNEEHANMYYEFLDFIQKCLIYNPNDRIKPHEALKHPFCVKQISTQTPTVAAHSIVQTPLRRSSRFGGAQCPVKAEVKGEETEMIANLNIAHRLRPRPSKNNPMHIVARINAQSQN